MPRAKRGGRRSRARTPSRRKWDEMRSLLLDIEPPLRDAMHYVWALHFIGMGLIADDDDAGEPVATVARAATEQLEAVRAIWDRLCGAALRPKLGKKLREHE
jgi:hypothetical protein